MEVRKDGSCVIVVMNNGQNIINKQFIENFNKSLDTAENYQDATCLVTIGEDKYFSTGVDVNVVRSPDPTTFIEVLSDFQKLLARLLTFPMVTVAAINGHSIGGGAMLSLAHDHRIMRVDRGWFAIPIVKLGKTLPHGLIKLSRCKCPQPELHTAITLSKQYNANEAKSAGFVNQVSSCQELMCNAISAARELSGKGLDRLTLTAIKHDLYYDVYRVLNEPCTFLSHL